MAGVANSHGLHSPEEHGRTKDLGYGVLVVSYAFTSRYEIRVRRMARVDRYPVHRALQGKYLETDAKLKAVDVHVTLVCSRYPMRNSSFSSLRCTSITRSNAQITSRIPS